MKKRPIFRNLLAVVAISAAAIAFSSCEKNNIDESGMANLKVVNASPNSNAQNFYLANSALVTTGLSFTAASNYISTYTGSRLVAEFRNMDTNTDFATGELWLFRGESYTVYLAGEGGNARVKLYQDDLSSPPSGKARIKFIHLSDGAPSDIRIKTASGDNLVTNLSRNLASGYINIAPGTLSIAITGTALGKDVGQFDIPSFTAGRVYAVYITGASSGDIQVHTVEY
jgi:hypothetical protein